MEHGEHRTEELAERLSALLTDPDPARLAAALMLADGQRTEALRLLDLSSQLYGPSTPRGQAAAEKASRLRGSLEGVDASASE